jgi:hypothetical protein
MDSIDRAEIFIYRSALILVGFQNHNEAFVSFVHYQFNDLPIDDIYATQIQMIENDIPEIFKKAITKNKGQVKISPIKEKIISNKRFII